MRHLYIGDISLRYMLTYHADRAFFHRHGNETVSVHRFAADGHEHVSLFHGAGVIAHAADLLIKICAGGKNIQPIQYIL